MTSMPLARSALAACDTAIDADGLTADKREEM